MNTTGKMVFIANMLFAAAAVSLSCEEPNVMASRASSTTEDARIVDRYAVDKLYDGDPRTSWVEGQIDDGIGEWAEISIEPQAEIDTIEIMPGYFEERFWSLNNRVARMRITLTGDGGTESIEHTFRDEMTSQRIEIGSRRVSKIRLESLVENWGDVVKSRGRTVAGPYYPGPYDKP